MITPVSSKYVAAPFTVMKTDDGGHSAEYWAATTANLILSPDKEASLEARAQIHNLKRNITDELIGTFNEAKASVSATDIIIIASQASRRVIDIAQPTAWAHIFASAPIRAAIEDLIRRNLASSCEIALYTE